MNRDLVGSILGRSSIFHRCFLPSFSSFGGFQRRRLKCEKLTDAKWWQKLTLPLARWAKNSIKISKSKFTLTLIDLGYTCTYKKIGDNRRVLYDQVSIINDRCNYLRKIKSFREVGYDIVYMDETWVNQNHCTDYMRLPNDGSDVPKISSGKGKRLIVLHAGLCKIVLENNFLMTKIWAHRIFCFNIVITCII
jgi:hypothetical protein